MSSVREPASRAEGNRALLMSNGSVSVPSACSAGPLAHELWLRRGFQRLGVNLPLRGRQGPWGKEAEGSANEAADVGVGRFGLGRGPSAAAESAFSEDSVHGLRSEDLPLRSTTATEAR